MTVSEVYAAIIEGRLYRFNTAEPLTIVRNQIRRRCEGLDIATSIDPRQFVMFPDGRYWVASALAKPLQATRTNDDRSATPTVANEPTLLRLRAIHKEYVAELKQRLLERLRTLEPHSFEKFARRLLEVYGFRDVIVTRKSRDGGIDGKGRLKVGFAEFTVAFQCKKWSRNSIQRPEIDKFRGAIQGKCEQGIFFTTSTFTPGAGEASFQPGAVPVILVDGASIVDLMLDKGFGVEKEELSIHHYALDLIIEGLDVEKN
jgi:restriction system protein